MPNRPIPLFFNSFAGRGRAGKRLSGVRDVLTRSTLDFELIDSSAPGDIEAGACRYAQDGHSRILVAGGDGSIHEAVNGVLSARQPTALGIIPLGTGNDFAKALALPRDYERAIVYIAEKIYNNAAPRSADAGRMNKRFFANGAGIGFDAKVNRFARSIQLPIGSLVYLLAIFKSVRDGLLTPRVCMNFLGQSIESTILLANIGNGPRMGGMFNIAPMAKIDDGRLDLIVVDAMKKRRALSLVPDLLRGRHLQAPEVSWHPIKHFTLSSDSPLPSHLDGESQPLQSHFDIEILPGALRLI